MKRILNGENNDTRYTKDNKHSPFSSRYRSRLRQCEILEVIIMIILEFKTYDRLDFKKKMKVCTRGSTKPKVFHKRIFRLKDFKN